MFRQKREGESSKPEGPTGVEARGGTEDKAAIAQKRPRGRLGAQMGAPCRENEEQLLVQGQLRRGLHDLKSPEPKPLTKKSCLEPTPATYRAWPGGMWK